MSPEHEAYYDMWISEQQDGVKTAPFDDEFLNDGDQFFADLNDDDDGDTVYY